MNPTVEMIISRAKGIRTPIGRSRYFQRQARNRCTGTIESA
jgi:hypothetical protein